MVTTAAGGPEGPPLRKTLVHSLIRGTLLGGAAIMALRLHSDPDLWGHLRFGLDFWSDLSVLSADPYSFTNDRAWINHEWLFEAFIGLVYLAAGTTGLAVAAAAIVLTALLIARTSMRRAGVDGWRLDALTATVFLLGISPLTQTMRPQAASSLLFVVLLALMREFDFGRRRALFALPPLFLLWANTHGGWVMGGGVLAIWTFARVIEQPTRGAQLVLLGSGAASAALTFLNPYGADLWRFLIETVRLERADIYEWLPVTVSTSSLVMWGIAASIGALALVKQIVERTLQGPRRTYEGPRGRPDLVYGGICLLLAFAAFRVQRLVPFFTLAVLVLLGPWLTAPRKEPQPARNLLGLAAASLICMLCVGLSTLGPWRVGCLTTPGSWSLDHEAGAFLKQNRASGRVVVWYDWGEYVSWHFGSDLKVSMDGRRETVFSDKTVQAHAAFYRNANGAQQYLERLAPDYVWLPNYLPVTSAIPKWGWQPIFKNGTSTVWTRSDVRRAWTPPLPAASSCFPAA